MADEKGLTQSILVVGGGISGLTTAVEAAEAGRDVFIVEKRPYLGGRVAQLNQYFPKLCPPTCGLEINFRRMRQNPRIKFFTMAEVEKISGEEGNFDVAVRLNPRYVNENCTACGACAEAVTTEIPNEFNYGMDKVRAAYLPHQFAFPMRYVIAPQIVGTEEGAKAKAACKYDAVELEMKAQTINLKVGAVVYATGWKPYDASKIDNLGFGKVKNVVTNVMMERLAAANGPTAGKILRPSDGKPVGRIAFAQCAGSRDENHLPFCSYICCLASLKQATYIREQNPESKVTIFYIDIRALGRYEDFYTKVAADQNVTLIKGKVAKVTEDPATGDVIVEAEDIYGSSKSRVQVDLLVLATGMEPTTATEKVPGEVRYDESGFVLTDQSKAGIYATGCARKPLDVATANRDATAAALKAMQSTVRR
jgi:quinone-modifying oxidoreductase, subunit QmoA